MKKLFSFVAAVLCAVSTSAAVDVLTADSLGITEVKVYADFEGVTATSDAVYFAHCAKNEAGDIQLRSDKSNSGIVSTTSGGKLTSVSVAWGTGNAASGRTVQVYGSNTAYTSPADLYNSNKAGKLLGTIVITESDTTTTVTVEGDYTYVGLRSKGSSLYLASVSIEWEESEIPEPEPEEPEITILVDTLTADSLGATRSGYDDITGVKALSDAVYAAKCMTNASGDIQLNGKDGIGVVSTASGGKLTSVSVVWGAGNDSRTLQVYGSNTPYTSPADLYDSSKAGNLLGGIIISASETTTTLTVKSEYAYIGLRSKSGVLYLRNISIEWEESETHDPEPEPEPEPVGLDTLTCVAAAAKALAGVTDTVVVIGYVTEIKEAWSSQYKNLSFWMADSVNGGLVFQAHRAACATAEDAPSVGDKVSVKGKLTTYKDTVPEMAAGCTFTILEHATEPDEPVVPTVIDTLTCAAAAEAALAGATDSTVVIGYVTEIAYAWSAESKNLSFWMADSVNGGKVFEAYKAVCESEENVPGVGDKVAIKGKLMKFNNTPEMTGCTFTILERNAVEPEEKGAVTIAAFLEAKDKVNIYTLTGTVSDIAKDKADSTQYSVYGNFNLTDSTGTIYIYGLLTADGVAKKFREMNIHEGDVITLKGSYYEYNGNPQIKDAIFVSKSSGETALEAVRSEEKAEKRVVNGQLVIIRNGVMYNAAGTRME